MEKIKALKHLLMIEINEAYADGDATVEDIKNEVLDFTSEVLAGLYEDTLCTEEILEEFND